MGGKELSCSLSRVAYQCLCYTYQLPSKSCSVILLTAVAIRVGALNGLTSAVILLLKVRTREVNCVDAVYLVM